MSTTALGDALAARIQEDGPIPFHDVMEACLYDPEHGYYAQPDVTTGREGDFATAPDTGPLFGATVARAIQRFAEHGPGRLVEVGPGSGRFMADVLDALPRSAIDALDIVLVDPFETHHDRLAGLADAHEVDLDVVASLEELEPARTMVVMNEVFDALPCHPVKATGDGWQLLHVDLDEDGSLVERWDACPAPIQGFCDEHAAGLPDGHRYEANPRALGMLDDLARVIDEGIVLTFDYGDTFDAIWPAKEDGTLRGFREHRVVDPLEAPGRTDITYDVDFTMLQAEATARGLAPCAYGGQERLLVHLGLVDVARSMDRLRAIRSLVTPGGFGGRFQALALSVAGGAGQAGLDVDLQDPGIWDKAAKSLAEKGDLGFIG